MESSVLPAPSECTEARNAPKHPTMHRAAPSAPPQHQRIIQSKISNSATAEKSWSTAVVLKLQCITITWRGAEPQAAGIYSRVSDSVGLGRISNQFPNNADDSVPLSTL